MKSLYRLFEQIYMRYHLCEMAALGKILVPNKKTQFLCVFLFNREYNYETPHINIGPNNWTAWVKIEIPISKPGSIHDFEILDFNKRYIIPSNRLKIGILNWFNDEDRFGVSNWQHALTAWEKAMESLPKNRKL